MGEGDKQTKDEAILYIDIITKQNDSNVLKSEYSCYKKCYDKH